MYQFIIRIHVLRFSLYYEGEVQQLCEWNGGWKEFNTRHGIETGLSDLDWDGLDPDELVAGNVSGIAFIWWTIHWLHEHDGKEGSEIRPQTALPIRYSKPEYPLDLNKVVFVYFASQIDCLRSVKRHSSTLQRKLVPFQRKRSI